MARGNPMKLFDPAHPFFAPLWRRIAIVVATLGWALFEAISGNLIWGMLFGAIGFYCAYQFFIAFDGRDSDDEDMT